MSVMTSGIPFGTTGEGMAIITSNVGYRLVWGYRIVSTDLKIILLLWKCLRVQFCSFVSTGFCCKFFHFLFLVFNCFYFILKYFLFLFLIIIIFNLIIFYFILNY